ncbi:hypothetical protein BDZ85DRAFT_267369 [Elsinoe ampelina]|uniref:Uncharacterized protein n=1 Tax=Elsinoe ampelina TaxID=302913 RepID=A0A6A6G3W2_9PEZI|nr:hypothetical protein BDZ85DRAFT_267369 [Elsinoe ampelina]
MVCSVGGLRWCSVDLGKLYMCVCVCVCVCVDVSVCGCRCVPWKDSPSTKLDLDTLPLLNERRLRQDDSPAAQAEPVCKGEGDKGSCLVSQHVLAVKESRGCGEEVLSSRMRSSKGADVSKGR